MSESLQALGLGPDATLDEVKARYKQIAFTAHPDNGGSATEFTELHYHFTQAVREVVGRKCPECGGKKRVTVISGFHSHVLPCSTCC